MRIISWNVNGIRAGIKKGFLDKLYEMDPDIMCIQETKAQDDQVQEALKDIEGYEIFSNSAEKKGYSGTCILTKSSPQSVLPDIGEPEHDNEGRVLRASYDEFDLVNVYVANSGSGLKRLDYREAFDEAFNAYLYDIAEDKPLIVTGDFNVAPTKLDLARPEQNYNKTSGFTQTEIDGVEALYSMGLFDAWRSLYPDEVKYTFWNQRLRARETNVGWRIDYFLMTENLRPHLKSADILTDVMGSDHCPIQIELEFK